MDKSPLTFVYAVSLFLQYIINSLLLSIKAQWLTVIENYTILKQYTHYSLEERGLLSTFCSGEMLRILPYFMYKKTPAVFCLFFISCNFQFYLMNSMVYVDIDQGIHRWKMKVAWNEKGKKLLGFSFYINIGNFEAFLRNLNLSEKCLFWRVTT